MWLILCKGWANRWRTVFRGPEAEARRRYLREHARLRYVHLVLVSPERKLVAHQSAARLRLHQ